MLSRAPILIGDIWERRNRSYLVFLSSRPPFEGILFWRGSTNIIRAPSWAFNGSTVCIPERRVSADTLFPSCNRVARFENQSLYRIAVAPHLRPHFCDSSAESLRCGDWSLQARRRHADACKNRRRYSVAYGCGEWTEETHLCPSI